MLFNKKLVKLLETGESIGDSQMEEKGRRKYTVLCTKNTSFSNKYQ